eukprot:TRINITY_DN449_c0_g1_i6.p1 TRINITY_DN449_c0_g1~~TRINITY_DN449_c0_g1_i6.p1  ORF type:complete len:466 (+),score=59.62 TRINITY_DN449_c0_g1_i6:113-1510(+)
MISKILLFASLLCTTSAYDCSGKTITDCLSTFSAFYCSWYPTTEQCLDNCMQLNQTQCLAAGSRCSLLFSICITNNNAPCDLMPLTQCTSNTSCEVVPGDNTCQDCTKVTDASECGRIGCNWNRMNNSCSPLEDFCNFGDETSCNENSCLWYGGRCYPTTRNNGLTPVCASPDDKNCIINDANTTCENITSFAKCKQQGTCDWSTITNSCYEADICQRVGVSPNTTTCTDAGCIQLPGICTAAPAFKNCSEIDDRDVCNDKKRCVSVTDNNQTTCKPFLQCSAIKNANDCTSKPGCFLSDNYCRSVNSGSFKTFSLECGGKPCENLNKNPDITTYQLKLAGVEDGGSAAYALQTSTPSYFYITKDSVPCVGCTFCETGFVPNLQAGFTCGKSNCAFSQQICIKGGEYPPEDQDWVPSSSDSSSGLAAGIIVVIVLAVVVVLGGVGGGVYKSTRGKNDDYESIQSR